MICAPWCLAFRAPSWQYATVPERFPANAGVRIVARGMTCVMFGPQSAPIPHTGSGGLDADVYERSGGAIRQPSYLDLLGLEGSEALFDECGSDFVLTALVQVSAAV